MKLSLAVLLLIAGLNQVQAAEISGPKAEELFKQLQRMGFRPIVRAGGTTLHAMNLWCERAPLAYRDNVCHGYDAQAILDLRENLEVDQDPAWALFNAVQACGAFKKVKEHWGGVRLAAKDIVCTRAVVAPSAARNAFHCTVKP